MKGRMAIRLFCIVGLRVFHAVGKYYTSVFSLKENPPQEILWREV